MNLGLISPRCVIDAAIAAHQREAAPLASVEGFVRQILGWREFVRGLYRTHMPGCVEQNNLGAHESLPAFF